MKKLTFYLLLFALVINFSFIQAQCNNYSVPHHEGFQGITAHNELPLCWQATNLGTSSLTFTNASVALNGAAFYYSPAGSNYFFSPGFALRAGVIYSVSVWYMTGGSSSSLNWTDLSLMIGTGQSSVGMVAFASTNGPVSAMYYVPLSGTVAVTTDGNYHFAIRGTSNGTGFIQHLSWDDFYIEIPCQLNAPSVTVSASSGSICSGETLTIQAAGANTYSWNTGHQVASFTTAPMFSQLYQVTGTSTVSGCSNTATSLVTVHPNPALAIISPPPACLGKPVTLQAMGNNTVSWSIPATGNIVVVTPTVTTAYSYTSTNAAGCKNFGTVTVQVLPAPPIMIGAHADTICAGEQITLQAQGGISYTWSAAGSTYFSNTVQLTLDEPTTITLTGQDMNGCRNEDVSAVTVNDCAFITEYQGPALATIFPNPCVSVLMISHRSGAQLMLTDLTGKLCAVPVVSVSNTASEIDLRHLAGGMYLLSVITGNAQQHIKVVREGR